MADYLEMDRAQLEAEKARVQQLYDAFAGKGLKLDMSRGKPGPDQLELSMPLLEMTDHIDNTGVDARNYGNLEGLPEARQYFAQMMEVTPEETIVAGNSSLNMMYNMVDLGWRVGFQADGKPWKDCEGPIKFLCPSPGYDRHFRVTEAFGFELVIVPMTPDGPDMDMVEDLVGDEAVKGIWCIPVYSNPDGYVYSDDTVRRLATMKTAAPDFRVFWDNAYFAHHLTDEPQTCLNLLNACKTAGNEDRALMFYSTSKITFAGAGVCSMACSAANFKRINGYLSNMSITFDKVNQLRHVRFLQREGLAAHMKKQAALIAPKFSKVLETLRGQLDDCGGIARWTEPLGGYFISLYTLDGCAKRVVELCKQAGVVLTGAGAAYPYGIDPSDNHIRIAPTYPPIDELAAAAELLCISTRLASLEKLLET